MKSVTVKGWGLSPVLAVTDYPAPTLRSAHDVRVAVHAASVNPKDWKLNYNLARGATPVFARRVSPLFGDDLAGVVIETGSAVRNFSVGDEVYGMDMRLRTASLAEETLIDQRRIALKPPALSFQQAASMPLAALTALQGLRKGKAASGKTVLIIGASGGVGTFAVQIAKIMGLHVTAVCSGRNRDLVTELGADAVIDYTQGDYRQSAGPFDLVFDVTSYESPLTCKALIADGGWFITTGGDARSMLVTPLYRVFGIHCDKVVVESWRDDLNTLSAMVDSGRLTPVIDSVFPLADSQGAYDRSRSGRCRGKVVIAVS